VPSSQCSSITCLLKERYDSSQSSSYKADGTNFTDVNTNVTGFLSQDSFTLGDAVVDGQTFGEATNIPGLQLAIAKYDGILGLDYGSDLVKQLKANGDIETESFSVVLNRNASDPDGGAIIFGSPDPSRYSGLIYSVPLIDQGKRGWRVQLNQVIANGTSLGPYEAVVNTGTALIGLPKDDADALNTALGGAVVYSGEYAFNCDTLDQLPDVEFDLFQTKGGFLKVVVGSDQYVLINDTPLGKFCFSGFEGLTFGDGVQPHVALGYAWLAGTYNYFDQENAEYGIANLSNK
jgi:hypothetical protein